MASKSTHRRLKRKINASGSIGALLGIFVITSVEAQRLWPSGTSFIYLAICIPLLLIWIAFLAGWKLAKGNAGVAVDISIYILFVASLGIRFSSDLTATSELASTLLFWTPLIAAWWTWRYRDFPHLLWFFVCAGFVVLTWHLASHHERIDEHLILSLLIALLVRHAYQDNLQIESDPGANLRDPLTGLPSPECFEAELAHVSAIADRYQFPLTLIGCRIQPGDNCLQAQYNVSLCRYAEALADRLRTADTACHWDPATFVILLPNTSESEATVVANGIRTAFKELDLGSKFPLTIDIHVAQHSLGEDPMCTVSALEYKLAGITQQ